MLAKEVPSSPEVLTTAYSSLPTGLYNPKAFITHAASLRQTFVHCARFPTAASRRSLDRVSVPVWLIILSDQLPVFGLVGHYPANYLMGRGLVPERKVLRSPALTSAPFEAVVSCCISPPFGRLSTTLGKITHVLLTRAPLNRVAPVAFDLHVLGAPLTFVLSQDQTLQLNLEREFVCRQAARNSSGFVFNPRRPKASRLTWHPSHLRSEERRCAGTGPHIFVSVRFSFQGPRGRTSSLRGGAT